MKYLVDNFLTVVVVLENDEQYIIEKLDKMYGFLSESFKNFEVVLVDNKSSDGTLSALKEYNHKITIIELAKSHKVQMALTAGVDIAIGDYIVEIPSIKYIENWDFINKLYLKTQEGFDFVFYAPKNKSLFSKLFYKILNKYFKIEKEEEISSSIATISSRRGQNKVANIGNRSVNRNIAYVLSGLKYANIRGVEKYKNNRKFLQNVSLFIDTLVFYTDALTKLMVSIAVLFFCFSVAIGLYSVFAKLFTNTAYGWTSTVLIQTMGFSGIFVMFAIVAKYLSHILINTLESKTYIYRDVIKKNGEEEHRSDNK